MSRQYSRLENPAVRRTLYRHVTKAIAPSLSRRQLVVCNMAFARKFAPALYPPPDKGFRRKSIRLDGPLPGHDATGPRWLRRPEVASLVIQALGRGAAMELYDLRAFVVMDNHTHVLIRARQPVSRVLQWIKGTTAREANQLLARTGQPFWQRESYDHVVRDKRQLERITAYIEDNPVKAGLATEPSKYQWSSAWPWNGELKFTAAR